MISSFLFSRILRLPQAADETMLDKLKQLLQDNPFFITSSKADLTFVIQHFAGAVKYHIEVECNSQEANVLVTNV